MRDDYPRQRTSVLTWLLCSVAAGFLLQWLSGASWAGGGAAIEHQFGLTVPGLRAWRLWTVVTHGFLHDTHYIFHVIGSLVMIYFFGREILPTLGARRFLGLFFAANAIGAVAWSAVHWRTGGTHLGSMAAAGAMLMVFACSYPNRRMDFLFLFMPVSLKPKHLAWASVGLSAVGLIFFEIGGGPQPFGRLTVASSAHLGGMLAGWLYYRFVQDVSWRGMFGSTLHHASSVPASIPAAELDTPIETAAESRADLRARVDRVLDKINSHGFGSLSAEEKRLLDEAKDLLSRH